MRRRKLRTLTEQRGRFPRFRLTDEIRLPMTSLAEAKEDILRRVLRDVIKNVPKNFTSRRWTLFDNLPVLEMSGFTDVGITFNTDIVFRLDRDRIFGSVAIALNPGPDGRIEFEKDSWRDITPLQTILQDIRVMIMSVAERLEVIL